MTKIIDVIISVIKSLFSNWIQKFKDENPSGFRIVGLTLVGIAGVATWAIANSILPQYAGIFEIVAYAAAALAALFGMTQLAAGAYAQELNKSADLVKANAVHTRTVLLTIAVLIAFVGSVYLITKNGTVAPAPQVVDPSGIVEKMPEFNPDDDPAKPLVSYFVQLLATKADTLQSLSGAGLPSVRVPVTLQYTISFFPVQLNHVPTIQDFKGKIILKDGYELDRVVNTLIYPGR